MVRFLIGELPRVVLRLAMAFAIYGLIGRIPWPPDAGRWILVTSSAILAAAVLVICGKLLYDTLYYDHYWRQVDSR